MVLNYTSYFRKAHIRKICLWMQMYTSAGSPYMWEGPMHVSMRVCVYVCLDSFRKGELWLLAGCYPALPSHLGCVLSRQLLSRRLHRFFYEAPLSLSHTTVHMHTHARALLDWLSTPLCTRDGGGREGKREQGWRTLLVTEVCASGLYSSAVRWFAFQL